MTQTPVSTLSFKSVEQLDELPQSLGWPLQYRQLEAGSFSSTFSNMEGDAWFLMEEQSSRTLEVEAGAPSGMYMLGLVEGEPLVVNGKPLCCDQIFLQSPNSDFRTTIPANTRIIQIGVMADHFRDLIHAAAPRFSPPSRRITLLPTATGQLTGIRRAMRAALYAPSRRKANREETLSGILSDIVTVAADHSKKPPARGLNHQNARQTLHKAREYIEAHLHESIRVTALCRYARTNLRALERIFAREMGLSPQQYVKARRLNSIRRSLLSADREQGSRVTQLALNHGFNHLGRFAGDYRDFFGEYPLETIKRDRVHT